MCSSQSQSKVRLTSSLCTCRVTGVAQAGGSPAHITDEGDQVPKPGPGSPTGATRRPGCMSFIETRSQSGAHRSTCRGRARQGTHCDHTLLPQATHHLAHPLFPHLVLTGTPSSVGKASLGPATFSHTRRACCPIKTPALSRPSQAVNSLPRAHQEPTPATKAKGQTQPRARLHQVHWGPDRLDCADSSCILWQVSF